MSQGKITPKDKLLLEICLGDWTNGDFDDITLHDLLKLTRKGMVATRKLDRLKRGFRKLKFKVYPDGNFSQDAAYPVADVDKLFKKDS